MHSKSRTGHRRKGHPPGASGVVVAIGGSAGGIEAVKALFEKLPSDTGMTFVFVQHLDPHYESRLDSILAKVTDIRVSQVKRAVRIKPDELYLCPADKDLVLEKGVLKVVPRLEWHGTHLPIDRLFTSVANDCGRNAIGVLLSGNSVDGAAGLGAIKSAGGKTLVQDKTAQFPVMPESAIAKGAADLVLSPTQMAVELVRLSKREDLPHLSAGQEDGSMPFDEEAVKDIFRLLHQSSGIDFTLYKKATITRRLERRIRLNKLQTFEEYVNFLQVHEAEISALGQDLLINVTSFFRSPEAMLYLKRSIFPRMIKAKSALEPLRIWVPACSTGEEVYSIAMLLAESMAAKGMARPIQIFASDLSEKVLAKARAGIYSKEELKGVSRERLDKFFHKSGNEYQVIKAIRDLCAFSRHNVFTDPPFTRMDLISCSNLLIYLEGTLQKKIIATFYFALNPEGFLMLGRSETVGSKENFFTNVNKRFRIYTKVKNASPRAIMEMNYRLASVGEQAPPMTYKLDRKDTGKEKPLEMVVDDILLKAVVPPCVVVNKDMEILQFRGDTGPFLEHPAGKASLNLLKMARAGLGFELKKGIHKVAKLNERYQKEGIEIKAGQSTVMITIEVLPLPDGPAGELFIILFRQSPPSVAAAGSGGQKDRKIRALEAELLTTREDMRSIVEEQQSVNEELQSANEEVLSSNEELHSINEELETSKEEIEATNEELMTMNTELHQKNVELAEAQEYSELIISTIQEAVVVLKTDLTVKMANKTFYTLFDLSPADLEGKSFFKVRDGQWNVPELQRLLDDILFGKEELLRCELSLTMKNIGKKSLVFHVRKLKQGAFYQQMIFIAIEDVTQRVAAEKVIAEREAWFHDIADQTPALIWVADQRKQRTFFNRTWLEFTGRTVEQELGEGWTKSIHPDDRQAYLDEYNKSFAQQKPFQYQYRLKRHDGEYRWIMATGKPLYGADGSFSGFLGACNEIHDQQVAKEELEKEVRARTQELSQALNREKDLNEMKSRFVSIASHEFRTPLTAILSSVALLEKYTSEQFEASRSKHLGRIKSSINMLKEILNDFLSIEKLEENKVEIRREKFDIQEEIKDIEETARGILKQGQHILYTHSGGREVWTDKKILRNVLINLLSNASKFSDPDKDIQVASRLQDGKIVIAVRDKGIGISKEDQHQLFERFYRATNASNIQGTGLGLNIVKGYVDLVGGKISLESKIDEGSTFTIEIPAFDGVRHADGGE